MQTGRADRESTRRAVTAQLLVPAFVCAIICATAPAAQTQTGYDESIRTRSQADIVRYHAMLTAYAAGDDTHGVDALLEWSSDRLKRVLAVANTKNDPFEPWDRRRYGLAVMLHTDAGLRLSGDAAPSDGFGHLEIATNLLYLGVRLEPDLLRPLAQRWYFAVSRYLRDRNAPYLAERLLQVGRERLGDDPVILGESGMLAESLATIYAVSNTTMVRSWGAGRDISVYATVNRRMSHLNDAAKWLGRATALDPGNDVLRVHLGRMHALRLDDDEALRVLGDVLDRTSDDATAYLAAVFLGGVRERQGRLDQATTAYRTAIARFPRGHAAYVGLSEALQRSGKGDESREVLRTVVSERFGSSQEPLWWYHFEPPGVADARLSALRHEVRR